MTGQLRAGLRSITVYLNDHICKLVANLLFLLEKSNKSMKKYKKQIGRFPDEVGCKSGNFLNSKEWIPSSENRPNRFWGFGNPETKVINLHQFHANSLHKW